MKRRVRTLRTMITNATTFHRELLRRGRRVAAALGGSRRNRLWLRILPVLLFWRRRFTGPGSRGLRVGFTFEGRQLRCRFSELCDFEILEEVFVDGVYSSALPGKAQTVVDLGSHIGLSALYFAVRYPDARIIAVEPNPALQERLRGNTGQVERIEVMPVGVAGTSGEKKLKVAGVGDSWSASLDDQDGEAITTLTLADLMAQREIEQIDVLKIDIEGAEFDVLHGADLKRIGTITGELHPANQNQLDELRQKLEPRFEVDIHPGGAPWWVLHAQLRA